MKDASPEVPELTLPLARIDHQGIRAVIIPEAVYEALIVGIPLGALRVQPEPAPEPIVPVELSEGAHAHAVRRALLVQKVLALAVAASERAALAQVAREAGVGASTLRTWVKQVRGRPREEWELALAPAWNGRPPDVIDPNVLGFYRTMLARPEGPTRRHCYRATREAAQANGWGDVPSAKTLDRRLTGAASEAAGPRPTDDM